jgi:hypothetical protein
MKKVFTTVLPDEPYKTTTKKNITVECTYDGPRYLLLRIVAETGLVYAIDEEEEDLERIDVMKIAQHNLDGEGHYQVVLDAMEHTWEAAHVTGYYTHAPFDDYTETLPDGSTWTYHYDDEGSAVEQPFYVNDLHYNKETDTWTRPRYRSHAVSKKDFWASVNSQIETYTALLAGDTRTYTKEQLDKIQAHLDGIVTLEEKYKNVDHWKIPFPVLAL